MATKHSPCHIISTCFFKLTKIFLLVLSATVVFTLLFLLRSSAVAPVATVAEVADALLERAIHHDFSFFIRLLRGYYLCPLQRNTSAATDHLFVFSAKPLFVLQQLTRHLFISS
ncbi:MAG: hypothetical protein U7M05_02065 [Candidatus Igneacidithiobacillus chanchocoensis]